MGLTGVTRFPDSGWGTEAAAFACATIWGTAAGPLTGEGVGGGQDREGAGLGKPGSSLGTMPAEVSQAKAELGESSGGRSWRAGSQPAWVTAAVRAGHGQECHQICTPPTTLNLQK